MTLNITIGRDSVIADLLVKSHLESASISNAEERYIVQAGTEKIQEIHQCVTDAFSEASAILREFVTGSATLLMNDDYRSAGDLALALEVSERRAVGLATPLTDAIHKYVVDSAMAKFYRAVSRPEMAERHSASLPADRSNIDVLLYVKQEPVY